MRASEIIAEVSRRVKAEQGFVIVNNLNERIEEMKSYQCCKCDSGRMVLLKTSIEHNELWDTFTCLNCGNKEVRKSQAYDGTGEMYLNALIKELSSPVIKGGISSESIRD